uniref:Uncharacterized protein n=1 Tax=Romanomermis culicivorax TaxID=13658 RepID=A0A915IFG3_ROMCU
MIEQRLSQYPRKLKSKIIVKIMQIFHEADEELEEQQHSLFINFITFTMSLFFCDRRLLMIMLSET